MKTIIAPLLLASLFASASAFALTTADQYGSAANGQSTQRTIVIDSATRYVNIKHGETVTLRAGADTVSWTFDGLDTAFALTKILPSAHTDHAVEIYVAPEPLN
jgi:Cu/Ag efflux protein CusF